MTRILPLTSLLALISLGCSDSSILGGKSASDMEEGDTASYGWDGDGAAEADTGYGGGDNDDEAWGSEEEDDFLKLLPAVTDQYVFVANPARDTITRISVPSLEVITVEVGVDPDVVVTTSDYSRAITFNKGSDTISVIDSSTLDVLEVDVLDNLNNMEVSPSGDWAIAFHDADLDDGTSSSNSTQSFNEISIVDTLTGDHYPMVVGRNPHQVKFTEDSNLAVVISDEKLALINLGASYPDRSIVEISDDLLDPPRAEEIEITPNGDYAFIRQYGAAELVLVDLSSEEVYSLPVGDNPTDLDLSPDGLEAVIVDRGAGQIYIYPTEEPESQLATIIDLPPGELIGSLQFSPDSTKAVLYTTAAPVSHYTTWDLTGDISDPDAMTVRPLVKPIASVSITPTGGGLVIFHSDEVSTDGDPTYDGQHALTLVDLDDFLDNPMILPGEPTAYASSDSGEVGFYIMDGVPTLTMVAFDALLHWDIPLKSNPVHVGVLPNTNYAYVNQEHDLGRLSFLDPGEPLDPHDDELKTITGFELNSAIEH